MNSGPLTRETMVQNWSLVGAISRRRTSTSNILSGCSAMKMDERQRLRHPAPPHEPVDGSRQNRAEKSVLSNNFALESGDGRNLQPSVPDCILLWRISGTEWRIWGKQVDCGLRT